MGNPHMAPPTRLAITVLADRREMIQTGGLGYEHLGDEAVALWTRLVSLAEE